MQWLPVENRLGVGREKVFPFISRGTFYRMPNGQVLKSSQRGGQSVCIIYITTLSSQFCIKTILKCGGLTSGVTHFLGPSAERDVLWPLRCPFVSLKRWSLSTKGGEKQRIWGESHFSLTASFLSILFLFSIMSDSRSFIIDAVCDFGVFPPFEMLGW